MDLMEVFAKAVEANPQAGLELMQHTAYGAVSADVEAMRPIWEAEFARASGERLARAKVALARTYVAKASEGTYPDDSAMQMAGWMNDLHGYVSEIGKAIEFITFNTQGGTRRQQVQRDQLGRFSRIGRGPSQTAGTNVGAARQHNIAQPVLDVTNQVPSDPTNPSSPKQLEPNPGANVSADQIDTFQGRFEGAVEQAQLLRRQMLGVKGGNEMLPHAEAEILVEGSNQRFRIGLDKLANGELPPGMNVTNPISGIQVRGGPEMEEGAAASLRRGGRGALPNLGRTLFQSTNFGDAENPQYVSNLSQLLGPSGDSKTQALIGRLSIAGSLLASTNAAAGLADMALLVGEYGPEAARVLEPHARKAAYRYRGTERTPDPRITGWFEGEDAAQLGDKADQIDDGDITANALAQQMKADIKDPNPMEASIIHRGLQEHPEAPISGDSLEMGVRSDMAAVELLKTIPSNRMVSNLSRAAGAQLPSQGVLIDADGDVVSQAVGFGSDHYLPFNLGNLNRLNGGQYVRTRQQGGLTGEDIYASVMHGARSATVVSTSGVTRIEFAPDFRGARASSDKAFSMYDRYLSILDTVAGSGLYVKDLDAPTMATLEMQARRSTKGNPDPDAFRNTLEALKTEKREELSQLNEQDISDLTVEADKAMIDELTRAKVRAPSGEPGNMKWSPKLEARRDEIFNDLATNAREAKVRELNLNAEGYTLALTTLQQQFPYFIRSVEHEDLQTVGNQEGFLKARGLPENIGPKQSRGPDLGYVPPGTVPRNIRPRGGAQEAVGTPRGPAPTTPGPTPPAAEGTQATSAPAVTPDTTSAAARVSAAKGRASQQARDAAVSTFFGNLARMNRPVEGQNEPGKRRGNLAPEADKPNYADVGGTDADRAQWFLHKDTEADMKAAFQANPGVALALFTNISDDQLGKAIRNEYGGSLQKVIDENQPFGAETPAELTTAIRAQAMNIAEAEALTTPFVDPSSPNAMSQTGQAIGFRDITNLDSLKAVNEYAKANPELKALADRIGTDDNGNYLPYAAMSARMGKAFNANQQLLQARQDWLAAPTQAEKDGIKAGFIGTARSGDLKEGLDTLQVDAATLDNQFSATPMTSLFGNYEQLQRARTLIEVARVHGAFGEGSDANPKARMKPPWASGVLKAAPSSRRAVSVVSKEHPRSLEVQRRRAAGLPLVAPRP